MEGRPTANSTGPRHLQHSVSGNTDPAPSNVIARNESSLLANKKACWLSGINAHQRGSNGPESVQMSASFEDSKSSFAGSGRLTKYARPIDPMAINTAKMTR